MEKVVDRLRSKVGGGQGAQPVVMNAGGCPQAAAAAAGGCPNKKSDAESSCGGSSSVEVEKKI